VDIRSIAVIWVTILAFARSGWVKPRYVSREYRFLDQDKDPGFQSVQQVCTGFWCFVLLWNLNSHHACQPTIFLFCVPHIICPWCENLTVRPVMLQNFPKFDSGTVASLFWELTSMSAGLGKGRGLDDDVRLHCCARTHRYLSLQ
jgi:hypothetical protein